MFRFAACSSLDGGRYEFGKQGMGLRRLALELWVELNGQEERMARKFEDFDKATVWAQPGESHPVSFKLIPIDVVEFITVSMAFGDRIEHVGLMGERIGYEFAGLRSESHGST